MQSSMPGSPWMQTMVKHVVVVVVASALLLLAAPLVDAACPYKGDGRAALPANHPDVASYNAKMISSMRSADIPFVQPKSFSELDLDAVKKDIVAMLTVSQSFWPADFGNYGPFLIRQAWHCSGSYRRSDGRGGCDGGRQRFEPELSWADNTNLDKAKTLLWPIKDKYGAALSWGDLMILAGDTAIESMGGPWFGFCGGRIDDADGSASTLLGPTKEQQELDPCPVNGQCKSPLGTTTVGLIYVNPEGPMGVPDPIGSAGDVRDTFARMGMDDRETVALIGGGHTFGKAHGACKLGPGPSPAEDPANPWPGLCANGTFTSGFEGAWSSTPTQWSNNYFTELVNNEWENFIGPGGHYQWRIMGNPSSKLMMLTSDMSLLNDPLMKYQPIVTEFAQNVTAFAQAFGAAWYKLTTRDMGPVTRCLGKYVPPAQPFQNPLPAVAPVSGTAVTKAREAIVQALTAPAFDNGNRPIPSDDGYYGAKFVELAFNCMATYRHTDYLGGCNGARILLAPENGWVINKGLGQIAEYILKPIAMAHGLSVADTIVLAGNTAIEQVAASTSSSVSLPTCAGRADATMGNDYLSPYNVSNTNIDAMKEYANLNGLTLGEFVALQGRPRSPGHQQSMGFMNATYVPSSTAVATFSNAFFVTLFAHDWAPVAVGTLPQYKAADAALYMLPSDLLVRWDPEMKAIAQTYASDNAAFLTAFAGAWTKLQNADRFDGPTGNVCAAANSNANGGGLVSTATLYIVAFSCVAGTLVAAAIGVFFWEQRRSAKFLDENGNLYQAQLLNEA